MLQACCTHVVHVSYTTCTQGCFPTNSSLICTSLDTSYPSNVQNITCWQSEFLWIHCIPHSQNIAVQNIQSVMHAAYGKTLLLCGEFSFTANVRIYFLNMFWQQQFITALKWLRRARQYGRVLFISCLPAHFFGYLCLFAFHFISAYLSPSVPLSGYLIVIKTSTTWTVRTYLYRYRRIFHLLSLKNKHPSVTKFPLLGHKTIRTLTELLRKL